MKLEDLRADIDYRRNQITRQRKDIQTLERAGICAKSAYELLERMQAKVDELCAERDRLIGESRVRYAGSTKIIRGTQAAKRGL